MTTTQFGGWRGQDLVDPSGDRIGTIEDIYLDQDTDQPEWLAVKTGWFGHRISFVPLAEAQASGDVVVIPYSKDEVKDAPSADPDGLLSQDEEAALYQHYGLDDTDDAMTRSEEELRVGTRPREAGRARLRKWVETEQVSTTVPVTHEEVRIEREPVTDGNIDRALQGQELSEGVHEVTLMEEEAVATTETVPKERIRMEKETLVEQEQVAADIRKERIEPEYDPPVGR